jgi:uncharacterized LabA/DUF88 family protein
MRIAIFVDYWNLQLTLNAVLSKKNNKEDYRAKIDWKGIGNIFAAEANKVLGAPQAGYSFEGTYIYTSYNPSTIEGGKYKHWATTWLDRQPGINVNAKERKPKSLPVCSSCHHEITTCPKCSAMMANTVEKGVDTLLVTDLIRLAVSNSYDTAVIASSDSDMVPAVEFVHTLSKKVIQAGFPPIGVDLATQCWGSFDILKIAGSIER